MSILLTFCKFSPNQFFTVPNFPSDPYTSFLNIFVRTVNLFKKMHYLCSFKQGQESGLLLDGIPLVAIFTPIPSTIYSYTQLPISPGYHRVEHTNPAQQFQVI